MASILFDSYYRKLFEQHSFRSGILGYDDIELPGAIIGVPSNHGISKLLDMLMLAKDIDFHKDLVSFKKLSYNSLFPINSLALNQNDKVDLLSVNESDKSFLKKITRNILIKNVSRLGRNFSYLEKVYNATESDNTGLDFKLIKSIILYTIQLISEDNYDDNEWLKVQDKLFEKFGYKYGALYHLIIWQVVDTFRDVYNGQLFALLNGKCFMTIYKIENSFIKNKSLDVLKLVRVDFRDKIKSIPKPRNIEEALIFRENRSLILLRVQIDYWIESFQNQEFNKLEKIATDIEKASKEMNKIKKFQRFKEYDSYVVLTFLGNQIPILSNVISLFGVIEHFYTNEKIRKFGWIS